jgi:spermidine synthase
LFSSNLSAMKEKTSLRFLSIALMLSGAAGLVNQVVWQRALKVFLGGSETISSMIVVLVFLGGLGLGSSLAARSSASILFPSKLLAWVELALGAANLMVAWLLESDLAESVYQFQRAALAFGIPVRVLYASGAIAILGIPCLLMGTALPLAAQTMQAELGYSKNRLVNKLYFLNTLGAVSGAVTGVSVLMPRFGQTLTLLTAAGLNLVAGLVVAVGNVLPGRVPELTSARESACKAQPKVNEAYGGFYILSFGFGFCSLWYEMFLYRAVGLRHEPLPLVFSAVVTGFLLFWSVGAWISSKTIFSDRLKLVLILCSILMLGALIYFGEDVSPCPLSSASDALFFAFRKLPYFVPCLLFGMLFGLALARSIAIWGRDVGWFSAWNTLGACLGVLTALLVGYEMDLMWMIVVGVLLLLAMGGVIDRIKKIQLAGRIQSCSAAQTITGFANLPSLVFLLLAASTAIFGLSATPRPNAFGTTSFFGRDGVIVVDKHGNLGWDGLWHSRLARDNNQVGTYNWALAVDPILAHPTGDISEALVIGMGSGVTAATLAKLESVKRVDVYDINQTLRRVLARFPVGTMHVAQNPKIRIVWQDARSGLALNDKKYDLITQQPLYLKQAGSSILLSKEYFSLISKRLKENGVLCVYANGTPEQAFIVRRTASEIFPNVLALHNGYSLILSFTPLSLSDSRLAAFSQTGELWEEVRWFAERIGRRKWQEYIKTVDCSFGDSGVLIRDDFPIVEYPRQLKVLLLESGYSGGYPQPEFNWVGQ